MRLTLILTFALIFNVQALTYSQSSKLNMSFNQVSLKVVFESIKEQTGLRFIYINDQVDDNQKVDIESKDASVETVLEKICNQTGLEYQISKNKVTIYPADSSGKDIPADQKEGTKKIKGTVTDPEKQPLPGATITILGTTKGVITDNDGKYEIEASATDKLVFTFIGTESQIQDIGNRNTIDVQLKNKSEELDDVTIVAFAKQKKESVLASIETVSPADLKIPSSNLTTALAGRLSGIISYQRSGEPGQDNAQFFIRGVTTFGYKKDPLILIDGIELSSDDLGRLHPDDIAAFSIMKDATATALYGARGANGVILVTTKEGKEGKAKVSIRFENSLSQPTKNIEFADPITYMRLHNEAVRTRDPLGFLPYSQNKIDNTIAGGNPNVYPQTDWQNELLRDYTMNQRLNFNMSGGGKVARYYLAGGITKDNGILKVDNRNDFNSNIDMKRYLIRSNVNINVTPTTEAVIRMHGTFDDYRGPINGGTEMYKAIVRTNPVLFPAFYEPDAAHRNTKHILFGNYGDANYINPYAELVKGYKEYSQSLMLAQIELKQDLKFITEGLNFRILGNTTRNAYFDVIRSYIPFYYTVSEYDPRKDVYGLTVLNSNEGRSSLDYQEGEKKVSSSFYTEAALQYDRIFNKKHGVSGLLVGIMRQSLSGNEGSLQASLPSRNLGLSGRFTYSYDVRYFAEFNFGYNGTERFSRNERFGFFPSAGAAWYVSNEEFFIPLKKTISKLKLKATYGLVGNDQIGDKNDRFFYLSNVNINDAGRGYDWGTEGTYEINGVSISRYANDQITWETAKKTNIGIELGLWDKLEIQADIFNEYRYNILWDRLSFATFGLQASTKANVGEASSKGIDISVDYQENFQNGIWITARGNFTYARGIFEKVEEPDYSATPWLSKVGQPIDQQWGYIAERLFVDDWEVYNSPVQTFGGSMVRGGDIKYRDINGDDKITELDQVPIGYPTTPEIIYGFGISTGYKNFDMSVFFQGSARSSFWIDANATAPFINYNYGNNDPFGDYVKNNALLQAYADSYWSESNRDIYARWPRLSDSAEPNNTARSTWFMQDGTFLRLKSAEIGYALPKNFTKKVGVEYARFYASGTNLLTFSKFKLWDPEMGGNGLGYPVQRVVNLGVQVSF